MIIVRDKNIENSVYFPQNIYTNSTGIYSLRIIERGSNQSYNFTGLEDRHLVQFGFYTFFLDFSSVPEGEYEYTITDSNNSVVGKGIIRLNQLEDRNEYYTEKTDYIVYDKQNQD
jgi:hypothetical protein